jgi:epoxide hydrolase
MNSEITPFTLSVPEGQLDDLARRLTATRWPDPLPGDDWARGVPVGYLTGLVEYWQSQYQWRAQEARLNSFPQFTTEIDGQKVHFLHVRSAEPTAIPLIITHGWPGSVFEFLDVIGPLTDPVAYGGSAADAFHVVIPSLPGYGLSGPITEVGWAAARIAGAWDELMKRLGYDRYGAQGGDLGALVAPELGRVAPDRVIGVHVNAATFGFIPFGDVSEEERSTMTESELRRLDLMANYFAEQNGYFQMQATRPQTISYALNDSPVGLLAWIVEKFKEWTDPGRELPEDAVDIDTLLSNVMLYWLSGSAGSAANLYYENMHSQNWHATPATTPTGVAVFTEDISIRRYAEPANNIVYWSEFDRGGHFAALEAPDLFTADLRAFFRDFR